MSAVEGVDNEPVREQKSDEVTVQDNCDNGFWRHPKSSITVPFEIERVGNLDTFEETYNKSTGDHSVTLKQEATQGSETDSITSTVSSATTPTPSSTSSVRRHLSLQERFDELLDESNNVVDFEKLKKLSWSGIPYEYRPLCWKILLGYLPVNRDRHASIQTRKRQEYLDIVARYFSVEECEFFTESTEKTTNNQTALDDLIRHQISIDVPRTAPDIPLFQHPRVRQSLLRILYCWSIRRPATGYVQGINDLVTPLFLVFISEFLNDEEAEDDQITEIESSVFAGVEADTFWCLSNLLDSIQDNYTFNQSGIHRQITLLQTITTRIDPQLTAHLNSHGLNFVQFAFRWINCLLLREFRLPVICRLWDAYLSEGGGPTGFRDFHGYVCGAFLLRWRRELVERDFSEMLVLLQAPPTADWTERDVELLLSEAFVLKSLFNTTK